MDSQVINFYQTLAPPKEAYYYFPEPNECKYHLGKQNYRRIFDGQIELDQEDIQHIKEFDSVSNYDKTIWTPPLVLRFLQANNFNAQNTLKSMQDYAEWKKTLNPQLDEQTLQFLTSGIIYVQGRDSRFRPIVVLNAYKIDLKAMPLEQQIKGLTFFLEMVCHHMLLPGQIENWVFILDLNYTGIYGLEISALKQVMGYLQNNYRSRLYRLYIVNTTMMMNITWGVAKMFLEENTIFKIQFSKVPITELFKHANKLQVEKKFGGEAENKGTHLPYWPPLLDNKNIMIENEVKLISDDEYSQLLSSGKLVNNKKYNE